MKKNILVLVVCLFTFASTQALAAPVIGPYLSGHTSVSGTYTTYGADNNITDNVSAGTAITLGVGTKTMLDANNTRADLSAPTMTLGSGVTAGDVYVTTLTAGTGVTYANIYPANGYNAEAMLEIDAAQAALFALQEDFIMLTGSGTATFAPGVYEGSALTTQDSAIITLDGGGAQNPYWIFNLSGALVTGANTEIKIVNAGPGASVIWNVGSYLSLGANTVFAGAAFTTSYIGGGANASLSCGNFFSKSYVVASAINLEYRSTNCPPEGTWGGTVDGLAACLDIEDGTVSNTCSSSSQPQPQPPNSTLNLGILESFEAYTADGSVTNSGGTVIGDIGTNLGSISGFPDPSNSGDHYTADAVTDDARFDLLRLYIHLAALPVDFPNAFDPVNSPAHAATFGSGETISPGVYSIGSAGTVGGALTLDGGGDPNAVFVIKMNGAFTVSAAATVNLTGGTNSANVFWLIDGAISVAAGANVKGTLFAKAGAVGIGADVILEGRMLTMAGAITMGVGSSATRPSLPSTIPIFCEADCTPAPAVDILGVLSDITLFSSAGAVANTGITGTIGNIGTNAGTITGYTGINIGTEEIANALTAQAVLDLDGAYSALMAMTPSVTHAAAFSNETLAPGVYHIPGDGSLDGVVILDAADDPDAIFVFRFAGALNIAAATKVILVNGAKRCNVFWLGGAGVVTGAVNIGASSQVQGTFMSHGGASNSGVGTFLAGRQLSTLGAVNTNTAVIYNNPQCVTSTPLNQSVLFDHFQIVHDGQGLTCAPESVTVKACADTTCTTLYTDAIAVDLSINSTIDQTINIVDGTTDAEFSYTNSGTATLSLDKTSKCENGGSDSCDVIFADTGFRFLVDNNSIDIPTQLSGKPSNTGYNATNLSLQAIKTSTLTGACEAALVSTKDIELVAECIDPIACAGKKIVINSTPINTQEDVVTPSSYTPVSLDFGSLTNNTARFDLTYPDAGKIQLHARYNIPVGDSPSGVYMKGSSNSFVVRPFGFSIAVEDANNIQNPAAVDHNGTVFMSAGDIFTTNLTAVQWKTGQDSNDDGIPDDTDNITNNLFTANFGNEITPETADITHALYLPKPATLGDLSNNSFNFINGIASNSNMTYSEVGIISFTANLNDNTYLTANNISGNAPYVGRFTPDHFALSVDKEGSFVSVCEDINIDMPFAYNGQMSIVTPSKGVLRYLEQPEILITPKSKLGNHTKNYTGDFNKLILSGVSRFMIDDGTGTSASAPISDTTQLGADETKKVRLTSNFDDGILTEGENENVGILSFQYNNLDDFFYLHEENSEIPPFTSDINLAIASIIDDDDVTAIDADGVGDTGTASDTVITLNPSGKEIRFGHAFLDNSFGPETADLPQKLSTQYLDASGRYVLNEDDNCTPYDAANKITLTSLTLLASSTGVNTVAGQLVKGETRAMILTAPGAGQQGTIKVKYEIYPWLKYNWDGVTPKSFDKDPTATATFGLFRGNDRIIYQREVFN
ncbi:MAG: hypothetical protein ACI9VT_000294 [Psychroserpens sp.]|jgi:hypothetical protein